VNFVTPPDSPSPRQHLIELFGRAMAGIAPDSGIVPVLDRPKSVQHGDFACNVALQLAKSLKRNPREIAQLILAALPASDIVERAEVAGAGFINVFLKAAAKQSVLRAVLTAGADYGQVNAGAQRSVQVEFVSANPTGPLHVGHGRGAAYGASLANVLEKAGWRVTREYYVNDAGRQMDILALSTWLRYLEKTSSVVVFPPNAYQGDYVRDMAQALRAKHGERFVRPVADLLQGVPALDADKEAHLDGLIANAKSLLGEDYAVVHGAALTEQLQDCKQDLDEFGVTFDRWFSEKSLYDSGQVDQAVRRLGEAGHTYQRDGALWFRSTTFGDEKDRVLCRENGQFTYFASDIAYHLDKFERKFDEVIDVWGADHHGYIPRVSGALTALGLDASRFVVALVQFAVLYRNGEKVSMSTRAGEFVTLRELRREVGNDAARFFYVLRKSDQHLDFDLDLAKARSNDNPVYYIQYAHARVCSVLREWNGDASQLVQADLAPLTEPMELELMQKIADFPEAVLYAATERAPHLIAFYLKELAALFHAYYNGTRFLVDDEGTKRARLALARSAQCVLVNGLNILGVSAPERM
jgi:arginyl-tRNA synthetase